MSLSKADSAQQCPLTPVNRQVASERGTVPTKPCSWCEQRPCVCSAFRHPGSKSVDAGEVANPESVAACYLAQFFPTPCDLGPLGRLTRAHVIPQQTLKREHQLANPRSPRFDFVPGPLTGTDLRELLDDPRNWRPACWRHHSHVDGPWGAFPIPDSTRDFAAQYGLELRGAG